MIDCEVFGPQTEGPGELSLRAGDIVTMVEKVDSEWYRGTCRGSTGFFPINHVKVLVGFSASFTYLVTFKKQGKCF